jgi:hypothetical protein
MHTISVVLSKLLVFFNEEMKFDSYAKGQPTAKPRF